MNQRMTINATRCYQMPQVWIIALALAVAPSVGLGAPRAKPSASRSIESLRLAIEDLIETFGPRYPLGPQYLGRLDAIETKYRQRKRPAAGQLAQLRREALLANPLIEFDRIVLLKRKFGQHGLPTNHQCNTCLNQSGYDNEIAILDEFQGQGRLKTLFRPKRGMYVGEMDLYFDADRLLFTMPNGGTWEVHEIGIDGGTPRQISQQQEGVGNFDACYLPDGRIVFASTASYTGVPCWHGQERACSLYIMDGDGGGVRQLCFDQDLDLHPSVLSTGQIIYSRWDYTGIMHMYLRPLMVMNPDGTAQRAVYGSNSYYPNALYFPRAVPGDSNKLTAILSGYHGPNRMGELVVVDTNVGWQEADGIVRRIMHRDEPAVPEVRDNLIGKSWPKFLHPYPLSDKYFLAAAQLKAKGPFGIYLVDAFDNMIPLQADPKFDFFEPIPVKVTAKPPAIPDRIDPTRDDAVVYLHNVYTGPGLADVPRGAVKRLRVVAYTFGYPGMAGPDKIGRGGPWDAMRILGTVPVPEDGSVAFRVPANTPISVQPLDEEGKALQLMRSWYTAMPGEEASCVGCHERPKETPVTRFEIAAAGSPLDIQPWYGPPRGFDFEREVQPVLDKYCVGCHNGRPRDDGQKIADLRSENLVEGYQGLPLSGLGSGRLYPEVRAKLPASKQENKLLGDSHALYTPAYEALIPYIRRVNVEDYVGLHVPGEYHADTSELVQMLQKGHHNVQLDDEAWDRLVTWVDLNGPCHGTWSDVSTVPRGAANRRWELAKLYGGPNEDPESVSQMQRQATEPVLPDSITESEQRFVSVDGWPMAADEAQRQQRATGAWERTIELGEGVKLRMVRIPAGQFVMGDPQGEADERAAARVAVDRDFWMGECEITNEQFRRFDPSHFPGLFMKRSLDANGPGVALDAPKQPVVRVSWQQAVEFCRWLSQRTEIHFALPSEAQWEYACRAGSSTDLSFGDIGSDFSGHANVADQSIDRLYTVTGGVICLQDIPSDTRFDDGAIATTNAASYRPNQWGLFDMHGNAAEWTRSTVMPYPYDEHDGRNDLVAEGRKVVRGGSFRDRPKRCRSAYRLSYPSWQRVHNVGFRVVCQEQDRHVSHQPVR